MKIYFEDGPLTYTEVFSIKPDYIIDAANGVSSVLLSLENIGIRNYDSIIYTNSILAFSNQYAWNKKLHLPEIYIRSSKTKSFVNISELTNRELKEGHNLAKLYMAGEFI